MVRKILYLVLLVCLDFSCTNSPKGENKEAEIREERSNKQENTIPMHSVLALSNKVEILLPPNFNKISLELMTKSYPDPKRRPDIIFRNPEGNVNISLQHTQKKAFETEMHQILEQLTSRYKSNPTIDFIDSKIEKINMKDFVVLEFISQGENNKVYNLMLITSLEDKVMMSAFTCEMPVIGEWKDIGNKLMRTIKVL
ncbi:MAG TPA: hypothetical protein VK179_10910 [Bacteroidales bacterium]|nr:hypothetical protein [Bacteroidales bacterium]